MTVGTPVDEATAVAPSLDDLRERRLRAATTLLALGAVLAWASFVAVLLLTARGELAAARQLADDGRAALLDGDAATAEGDLRRAAAAFARAERRLADPAVLPLRAVPVLRSNVRASHALAAAGARTAIAGEELAGALADLPGGVGALAPRAGTIPLEALAHLTRPLRRAGALLTEARQLARSAPSRGLVAPLGRARDEALPLLDQAVGAVSSAAALVEALPAFLGEDGPRRYFLGASSPSELRGTGGLIGAYALLTIEEGHLDIGDFAAIHDLPTRHPEEVPAPSADYAARYNRYGGAGFWQNLTMTPDFSVAAKAMTTLYEEVTGDPVDGVVVVDPHMFAGLLLMSGPVEVPGGGTVDADSVVAYVANEAYGEIEDPEERKTLLGAVAASALEGFLAGDADGSPVEALGVLGDAAAGGHLLLYAADPTVQAAFEKAGVAGRLLDPEGDYLAVIVNNAAANKADFYADRTVHYRVELRDDGSAAATAAVELSNGAPVTGHPAYVIGPNVEGAVAGDNRSLLSVYCAADCRHTGYRRSNGDGTLREEVELGRPVFTTMVPLQSGETERIELDWLLDDAWERDGRRGVYRLTVQDQPTIRPTRLVVDVALPDGMTVTSATEGFESGPGWARWEGAPPRTASLHVAFSR